MDQPQTKWCEKVKPRVVRAQTQRSGVRRTKQPSLKAAIVIHQNEQFAMAALTRQICKPATKRYVHGSETADTQHWAWFHRIWAGQNCHSANVRDTNSSLGSLSGRDQTLKNKKIFCQWHGWNHSIPALVLAESRVLVPVDPGFLFLLGYLIEEKTERNPQSLLCQNYSAAPSSATCRCRTATEDLLRSKHLEMESAAPRKPLPTAALLTKLVSVKTQATECQLLKCTPHVTFDRQNWKNKRKNKTKGSFWWRRESS